MKNKMIISDNDRKRNAPWRKWFVVTLIVAGLIILQVTIMLYQKMPTKSNSLKNRFQLELESLREQYGFPGATAAYILPNGRIGVVAAGLADVENSIPMTSKSRMLAASIGKTFTGAVAVALSQENVLNLDDPISNWLGDRPWFQHLPNNNSITLRQLLNHTAGIPNHVEMANFQSDLGNRWQSSDNPFSPEDLVSYVLDQPPLFKPGKGWYYSDTGYILVGLIIETVTGHSYYDEVTRRFLEPLNLELTAPSDHCELPGLAAGYLATDNEFNLPQKTTSKPGIMVWHPGVEWTGGGLISNSKDLVVWAKALYEGKAMHGNYLETLLQSVPISKENSDIQYGIGVAIYKNGPFGPTYGHGGWMAIAPVFVIIPNMVSRSLFRSIPIWEL